MKYFILILLLLCNFAHAAGINTFKISQNTAAGIPKCVHHRIKGVCTWLEWVRVIRGIGFIKKPKFTTTAFVEHYRPDLVVAVFPSPDKNPWSEMKLLLKPEDSVGKAAAKKLLFKHNIDGGQIRGNTAGMNNIRFKEAIVVGNPLGTLSFPMVLPSKAKPMVAYYNSMRDCILWRAPLIESFTHIYNLIPGMKEVGNFPVYTWGPLFPRTGFVNQLDDAKSAAVLALRAANIASTNNANLSLNFTNNYCGKYCEGPREILHNADNYFQMIYPRLEKHCHKLCDSNEPGWVNASRQENGSYVWAVWLKYKGCKDGRGKRISCFRW